MSSAAGTSITYSDADLDAMEVRAIPLALNGPLVPLLPPKSTSPRNLPGLSHRSSQAAPFGSNHPQWRVDRFVIPAAFPRSVKGSTKHPSAPSTTSPSSSGAAQANPRRIDANQAYADMAQKQLEGLRHGKVRIDDQQEMKDQEQLFLAVNRYSKQAAASPIWQKGDPPLLTLVFAHANGFHKETWEPTISDMLDNWDPSARPIGEMWSLDAINQGDSGVLNEDTLGNTFDWSDHGRDILNFLISYLPDPATPAPTTSSLPYIASPANTQLLKLDSEPLFPGLSHACCRTFRNRLIVGIGHSMGGCGMAFAATAQPSLFSSLIFVDAVLPPPSVKRLFANLIKGAMTRKETWKTRQEAKDGFLKKAFFRGWDERALNLYIELATKDLKGGGVALKCRARDEALVFGDLTAWAARRGAGRLPLLPTFLPKHFIFAEKGSVVPGNDRSVLLGSVPSASHVVIPDSGHLIAQEKPRELAKEISHFLRGVCPINKGGASAKL